MDNKNSPQNYLKGISKQLEGFIKSIEKGDGMNLTDEQKKEYKEQLEKQGVYEKLKELKEQKEKLFKHKI